MNFAKGFNEPKNKYSDALWFIFHNDSILLNKVRSNGQLIPKSKDLIEIQHHLNEIEYFGSYEKCKCYYSVVKDKIGLPHSLEFRNVRLTYNLLEENLFQITGYALQLANWDINSQYCGKCGSKNIMQNEERAKKCVNCQSITFPRISPAVIVAVIKGDSILLARSHRFKSNIYSVLAGFVEAGETLEECIHREIKEEVDIEVENIRYFSSQPWPFPDALMIAFIADYKSGEIKIDDNEIMDAVWYTKNDLPELPLKFSIARKLIDWFVSR